MSTKTSIKRIAAVAALALTLGGFSAVSANAALTVAENQALTGTATGAAQITAGTAGTVINTESTSTAATSGAFKITAPDGVISYVGADYVNATVGTVAFAAHAATLTFATTFLTKTGKYSVSSALGLVADLNTLALATTATAAATAVSTTFFVYKTTPTFANGTAKTVTNPTVLAQDVNGVATLNIVSDDTSVSYTATSTGVGAISTAFANNTGLVSTAIAATTGDTVTLNNGVTPAGGVTWTPNVKKKSYLQLQVTSSVAGATTVTVVPLNASGTPGTPITATVTFGSASVVSPTFSSARLSADLTQAPAASDLIAISKSKTVGTQAAQIYVTLNSGATTGINGQGLAASITGSGLLGISDTNTAYTAAATGRSVSITTLDDNIGIITVWADGSAGVGTIAITSTTGGVTTAIATKTVSFYGAVASVTATQNLSIARAGCTTSCVLGTSDGAGLAKDAITAALTPAVVVVVKDAAGVVVPGVTLGTKIADTTVLSAATVAETAGTALTTGAAGPGTWLSSVTAVVGATSGASTTVTYRVLLADGITYVSSTPVTFTLGGSASKTTVTTDKSAYSAGEQMLVTATAVDASGNKVYDGATSAIGSVTFSKAIGGSAAAGANGFYLGGKDATGTSLATSTVYAPSLAGKFNLIYTGTGATEVATSLPLSVNADEASNAANAATDAANEATDAANAATDAALAAADAADAATAAAQDASDAVAALSATVATLVASLKAQITSLTNLVIKIQKKVKA